VHNRFGEISVHGKVRGLWHISCLETVVSIVWEFLHGDWNKRFGMFLEDDIFCRSDHAMFDWLSTRGNSNWTNQVFDGLDLALAFLDVNLKPFDICDIVTDECFAGQFVDEVDLGGILPKAESLPWYPGK
jgi:hypothetical protein